MEIELSSFGQVASGKMEVGELTIVCGPNSSGKTYISYALHSFLRNFDQLARGVISTDKMAELDKNQVVSFDLRPYFDSQAAGFRKASERLVERLSEFFSVDSEVFSGSGFIATSPSWNSLDGMLRSSFYFSGTGYRGFKESGSDQLVVTKEESGITMPASITRNIIGGWLARASIGYSMPHPFAITSERTGVSLFYKDLDVSRNQLVERLSQSAEKDIDLFELALSSSSRYALPVKENIDTVRGFESISKRNSFLVSGGDACGVISLLDELLCGGFAVESKQLHYSFKVRGVRKKKKIPIYVASSAIKSLFLLNVFLKHVATKDSILVFDEPELNLHPSNQRKLAGVIVRLVNSGVKVFLTTHSDFLVREISARIALHARSESAKAFLQQNEMTQSDLLDMNCVRAFSTDGGRVAAVDISRDGINMETLNQAIGAANEFFEDALLF